MGDIAIHCEGLSKRYGSVHALDRLSLDVPSGTIYGLLGPNGAGKTTLIRLLTGLARPNQGHATVAGIDITTNELELHRRIGMLAQQPRFYGWMKGRELLEFTGELFGLRGTDLQQRVAEALEVTGLTEVAKRRISGYSGGMRQRLGLAQVLINQPTVLFLDEPASALDPAGRHDILQVIAGLRGQTTVFMSTHILADVERICDHVAIMQHGRLLIASTVTDLQERYALPIYLLEAEASQEKSLAAFADTLRTCSWVHEVVAESGTLRVIVSDNVMASHELLPLVVRQGIILQRFERVRPSLEDIFLRLTKLDPSYSVEVA
jgi:ABC-2 type transport system ATP-binding protein